MSITPKKADQRHQHMVPLKPLANQSFSCSSFGPWKVALLDGAVVGEIGNDEGEFRCLAGKCGNSLLVEGDAKPQRLEIVGRNGHHRVALLLLPDDAGGALGSPVKQDGRECGW